VLDPVLLGQQIHLAEHLWPASSLVFSTPTFGSRTLDSQGCLRAISGSRRPFPVNSPCRWDWNQVHRYLWGWAAGT